MLAICFRYLMLNFIYRKSTTYKKWVVLLSFLLLSQASFADETITSSVIIKSNPSAAKICTRESRKLKCFAKTPHKTAITFYSKNSSKRFHIVKPGFERQSVLIKPTDYKKTVKLKKRIILFDYRQHSSDILKNIQKTVNKKLENWVTSSKSIFIDLNFDIVGVIKVVKHNKKVYLNINLLVDEEFTQARLKKILRIKNKSKKITKLQNVLFDGGITKILSSLKARLHGIAGINFYSLSVSYFKQSLRLVDDDTKFWKSYTYDPGFGNYIYITYAQHTTGYSKYRAHKDMYTLIMNIPEQLVKKTKMSKAMINKIKQNSKLLSNENRKKIFEVVKSK